MYYNDNDDLYCSRCGNLIPYNQAVFSSDGILCPTCYNLGFNKNTNDFIDWDTEDEIY